MSNGPDDDLRAALGKLEQLIAARVRLEQLTDPLTGLPNLSGLVEGIRQKLLDGDAFWLAFVEVDRFKSINDRFGYEDADALLKKIADILRTMCSCFPTLTSAFRAHGDEFYLVGADAPPAEIEKSLNLLRQSIGAIRVAVAKPSRPTEIMSCTVSVGWLASRDLSKQTDRTILAAAERAVGEAKYERDCVVRFSQERGEDDTVSLRSDCRACGSKFSVDVRRSKNRLAEKLACPNCHAHVDRPPVPERRSEPAHENV